MTSPLRSMKKYIWFFCSQFGGRVFLCILGRPRTHNFPTSTSGVLFIMYLIFFTHYHPFLPCSPLLVTRYVFPSPFYVHVKGIGNVFGELIGKIFFFPQLSHFGNGFNRVAWHLLCSVLSWLWFAYSTWWILLLEETETIYALTFNFNSNVTKGDYMNTPSA